MITKLFDFSNEEEKLISKVYDKLFEMYDISVIDIENSPYNQFKSEQDDLSPLFTPKICYFITDKNKTYSFYLFIVNKGGTTFRGARADNKLDILQIWGLKMLEDDFGFISVNKKSLADKVAGIFSNFNINFKENRDFKDFYVLGSDPYKTMSFLDNRRKGLIKSFPDEDFKLRVKNNIISFGLPKELTVENAEIVSKFLKEI
ncbi:hypothetical protein [Chryseobacterium sp. Mn2064]|uniref:hypothetical protein n=1 Tax=Chryseobacterium sp. Mn2064 TaxID=3395263 RepID=UPI003BD0D6D5